MLINFVNSAFIKQAFNQQLYTNKITTPEISKTKLLSFIETVTKVRWSAEVRFTTLGRTALLAREYVSFQDLDSFVGGILLSSMRWIRTVSVWRSRSVAEARSPHHWQSRSHQVLEPLQLWRDIASRSVLKRS